MSNGITRFMNYLRNPLTSSKRVNEHELFVETRSGNLVYRTRDFQWQARIKPEIDRYYNSGRYTNDGHFGLGWTFNYGENLEFITESRHHEYVDHTTLDAVVILQVNYHDPTGNMIRFQNMEEQNWFEPGYEPVFEVETGYFLTLVQDEDEEFDLTEKNGLVHHFDTVANDGKLLHLQDRNGNNLHVEWESEVGFQWNHVVRTYTIIDFNEYDLIDTFEYDENDHIIKIGDSATQIFWQYEYDGSNNMIKVTDPNGRRWSYVYGWLDYWSESEPQSYPEALGEIKDPNGGITQIKYVSPSPFILTIIDAEDGETNYTYTQNAGIAVTTVSDPRGKNWIYSHNIMRLLTSLVNPENESTSYLWNADYLISKVTDPNTNETTFLYDSMGNLTNVTPPAGGTTDYTYDSMNNPLTIELKDISSEVIRSTTFVYDANGNRLSAESLLGNKTEFTYFENGDLKRHYSAQSVKDGKTAFTSYEYDYIYGVVTRQTDATGRIIAFVYDSPYQNQVQATDPLGNKTKFTYDDLGRNISSINPLGISSSKAYDALSNVLESIAAGGGSSTFTYDKLNRLMTSVDALGAISRKEYDANGNVTKTIDPAGNDTNNVYDDANRRISVANALNEVTGFEYDDNGNLTKINHPNYGTFTDIETEYGYNVLNMKTNHTIRYIDGVSELVIEVGVWDYNDAGEVQAFADGNKHGSQFTYDSEGKRTTVTNALEKTATTTYNANGQVLAQYPFGANVETDPPTIEYRYDAMGRVLETLDGMGNVTIYSYDEAGRRSAVTDTKGNTWLNKFDNAGQIVERINPLGDRTVLKYDAAGRVITRTDPLGNSYRTEYDILGRVISTITPKEYKNSFEYNNLGQLILKTEANGATTFYEYDVLGRRSKLTDPFDAVTEYEYNVFGSLSKLIDPEGNETEYAYDGFARLITTTLPDDSEINYAYDDVNSVLQVEFPNGNQINYTYDEVNQLAAEVKDDGTNEFTTTNTYYDNGDLESVSDENHLITNFEYDPNGRRTSMIQVCPDTIPETIVNKGAWTYDELGNQLSFTNGNGDSWFYKYDELNRVIERVTPESIPDDPRKEVYRYNAVGQVNSITDFNGNTIRLDYDKDGNLSKIAYPDGSESRYTWDCCRLTSVTDQTGQTKMFYDEKHRLTSVLNSDGHPIIYLYNDNNQRATMTLPDTGTVEYSYTGMGAIEFLTDTDSRTSQFVYDTRGKLATINYANGRILDFSYNDYGAITSALFDLERLSPYGNLTQLTSTTAVKPSSSIATMSNNLVSASLPKNFPNAVGNPLVIGDEFSYPESTGFELPDSPRSCLGKFGNNSHVNLLTISSTQDITAESHTNTTTSTVYENYKFTHDFGGNLTGREDLENEDFTKFFFDNANNFTGFATEEVTGTVEEGGLSESSLSILALSPHNVTTDKNGNVTKIVKGEDTYTFRFDYHNRLIEANYPNNLLIQHEYDGLGRRVTTRINGEGVRYIYDGYKIVQERNVNSDALIAEYTWFEGKIFKQKRGIDERWIYTFPEGGAPRHMFDYAGVRTDSLEFSWMGELVFHEGVTDIGFGWAGGWVFAYDTDIPMVLFSESNEVWLPTLATSLNKAVLTSQSVNFVNGTAMDDYTNIAIPGGAGMASIPAGGQSGCGCHSGCGSSGSSGAMGLLAAQVTQNDTGNSIYGSSDPTPVRTPSRLAFIQQTPGLWPMNVADGAGYMIWLPGEGPEIESIKYPGHILPWDEIPPHKPNKFKPRGPRLIMKPSVFTHTSEVGEFPNPHGDEDPDCMALLSYCALKVEMGMGDLLYNLIVLGDLMLALEIAKCFLTIKKWTIPSCIARVLWEHRNGGSVVEIMRRVLESAINDPNFCDKWEDCMAGTKCIPPIEGFWLCCVEELDKYRHHAATDFGRCAGYK
jgi:YD repeat-containing protein